MNMGEVILELHVFVYLPHPVSNLKLKNYLQDMSAISCKYCEHRFAHCIYVKKSLKNHKIAKRDKLFVNVSAAIIIVHPCQLYIS